MRIGTATFPGLQSIIGANYTMTQGITPSAALVTTVPQAKLVGAVGTLEFDFDGTRIRLRDCALEQGSLRVDSSGQKWTLRILDRRWKWQFGEISGRYNVRLPSGDVDPETEKTPQELAALLLEAMGEQGGDVRALPNRSRPEVFWRSANPAQELASLCESLGCRVVLGLNNRVKVAVTGKGDPLPDGGRVTAGGYGVQSSLAPSLLKVIGAPIRFQSKLLLEAVGEETDGSIKPIDQLSYKPADGWGWPPFHTNVAGTFKRDGRDIPLRELAANSVFRWFRVKEQAQGGLAVPGYRGRVRSVQQYHLQSVLVETAKDPDGRERSLPAILSGEFWLPGGNDAAGANGTAYRGGFSVDPERRLVTTSQPLFKLNDANRNEAPTLYLTTAYTLEDTDGLPVLYEREKQLNNGNKTGPMILPHPEIVQTVRQAYNGNALARRHDNQPEVLLEADHALRAKEKEFDSPEATEREYEGLVAIDVDGAITQVSWRVGDGQPAKTRASRNTESNLVAPVWKEMRRRERAEALAAKEDRRRPGEAA